MSSDQGVVLDLSLAGVRLRTARRWPEGRHAAITLSGAGERIRVEVVCMWCRADSDHAHVVGAYFAGLSEAEAAALTAMLHARDRGVALPSAA